MKYPVWIHFASTDRAIQYEKFLIKNDPLGELAGMRDRNKVEVMLPSKEQAEAWRLRLRQMMRTPGFKNAKGIIKIQ